MATAHREILHLARLLAGMVEDLPLEKIDRYLVRDRGVPGLSSMSLPRSMSSVVSIRFLLGR